MSVERIYLLGMPIDAYTYPSLLAQIRQWLAEPPGQLRQLCTVNPEFAIIAQHNPAFFEVLRQADACLPDGVGLLLGARLTGQRLPGRVTGSDLLPQLAKTAAAEGWRLYLLGAAEGVADLAAARLQQANPHLKIAGTYAGSPADDEAPDIIARVNASQADILLVAYGAPRQDLWIDRHRQALNVRLAMGVGGAFDYIAQIVPRAPLWMRSLGLEWVYRLYKQPWRWRRMLRLPRFLWNVLRYGPAPTPAARKGQPS